MLIFLPQASAASPTMALDGVAKFGCSCDGIASASVMLTTTHSNDVIVVIAQCGFAGWCDDNISSIVDGGGHVWTLRLNYRPYPNGRPVWEYYTVADTPLSLDVITVTWSGTTSAVWFVAFGSGRSWAGGVAKSAKHYRSMGVTYSSAGEYGNAIDILPPV